jgi:hypothetical protein
MVLLRLYLRKTVQGNREGGRQTEFPASAGGVMMPASGFFGEAQYISRLVHDSYLNNPYPDFLFYRPPYSKLIYAGYVLLHRYLQKIWLRICLLLQN